MIRLNEAIATLILIFNLLISNGICDSHISHYELNDVQLHHGATSHFPLQPELVRTFQNCHKSSGGFDLCIKNAFNELRVYFKSGKFFFIDKIQLNRVKDTKYIFSNRDKFRTLLIDFLVSFQSNTFLLR